MRLLIKSYFNYITKITTFFKHLLVVYIVFSSTAYPFSNNNQNSYNIRVNEKISPSLIMQKAFEAEILVKSQEYEKAAKIYFDISLQTEDPEIAKRATQLAGYTKDYELMLKSSDRWLQLAENKIPVRHIRISIYLTQNKIKQATRETLLAIKFSKDKDKFALVYDTLKVFDDEQIAKIFEKVYLEFKNEYLASFYYVQVLLNNNEYQKSIDLINQASKFEEFNKRESRWGIFLAKAYFELGKDDSSVKVLKEYLTYSPKDVSEEGTIVLRSSNIQNGRMHFDDIVRVKKDIKEKLIVLPNDILICSRNGSKRLIGKCSLIGIQEEPMTFGTFMMIVRSEFNYYLQWFFQSDFFKEQISQGQNTAINQITRYMLDEVKLPLPDISIQNKISKQLSEIDKNVRQVNKLQTQKIYELLKLKQAILKQELQPKEVA